VYGLAVARTSKHVADATTVAYLLGSASIAKIFSTTLGMASALRSGVSAPAVGDADTINKQAIISRSWIDPDPVQTAGIFRGMIEGTVSGSSKLNDAVSLADKQMQQVIGGVQ
jgi:hypothetical protein